MISSLIAINQKTFKATTTTTYTATLKCLININCTNDKLLIIYANDCAFCNKCRI